MQPEINIGTLGHVDNGKSTIVQSLTGVWTSRHSEELRRGITIRIGYADASFYECPTCEPPSNYSTSKTCPNGHGPTKFLRSVSFVDCPGHHSLMVTMLSGAAIMDASMLVVSATVKTSHAQDRKHIVGAQIIGVRNIILITSRRRRRTLDSSRSIQERRRDRNQTRHKDRVDKQDHLRDADRKGRSTTSRRRGSKNRHPRRIGRGRNRPRPISHEIRRPGRECSWSSRNASSNFGKSQLERRPLRESRRDRTANASSKNHDQRTAGSQRRDSSNIWHRSFRTGRSG